MTKRTECVVYVAGRYRSDTENGVYQNIQAAREMALKLWRPGVAVITPHMNTAFFGGAQPDEVWLNGDLAMLERCDVIVMLPGWWNSKGATAERAFAVENDIPVLESMAEFEEWFDHEWKEKAA